jgi:hypothetical protein
LEFVATAIVVPVAAGLGEGDGTGEGERLAPAVDGVELPQAAMSKAATAAPATNSLECMHPDTETGYGPAMKLRRVWRS